MALLVADCPRCGSHSITFDVTGNTILNEDYGTWEAFCVCRHCEVSTIFELHWDEGTREMASRLPEPRGLESVNEYYRVERHVTVADFNTRPSPEHVPTEIVAAFDEGAKCLAIGCFNAAAAMFRLALDIATRRLLPSDDAGGRPLARKIHHGLVGGRDTKASVC